MVVVVAGWGGGGGQQRRIGEEKQECHFAKCEMQKFKWKCSRGRSSGGNHEPEDLTLAIVST